MDNEEWILDILSNDEYSSDEELVALFMQEGNMAEEEANEWISKRSYYLNNIVLYDGTIYDPRRK